MTRHHTRARTTQPMLALFAGAVLTLAVLVASRPRLSGGPGAWTGDDLTLAGLWWGAAVASAWLGVTTLACVVAVSRGRTRTAHRLARWAPPLARHLLQAALVSTWALVPAAAYAAPVPSASSSGPIVVHVGADGRLTTSGGRRVPTDAPVVRTPETSPPATTPSTIATTTTAPTPAPRPAAPAAAPRSRRPSGAPIAPRKSPPPIAVRNRVHLVQPGDNLWRIARAEVSRTSGAAQPDDSQIAPYWQRLIAANRATLRSGNPSLIFPGELVTLPPP